MVQPIQYQVPVADPFAGLLQGLKLGATVQDLQASQQQRMLQQEQMRQQMMQRQQAMEQQQRAQAAMSQFFAKPFAQRSLEDYESLVQFLPKESFAALQGFAKQRTEKQNANAARLYSQMAAGILGKSPEYSVQLARQAAEGEANPQQKQAFTALANAIEKTPEAAFDMIVIEMMGLEGNYSEAAKRIFDVAAPAEAFKVLTPAEAKARGLPTQGGAQWQVNTKTGKVERLVEGEKPGPAFETLTAAQLTAKYGLTGVEPGLYKRRSDTGEISKIGGGGTTINMKTVSPPPKDYRYVYDGQGNVERMEVIPGSKTAKDLETAATAARSRTQTEIGRANIIVNSLDTLENLVKTQTTLDPVTGRTGALMGQAGAFKAGSKRADAEQAIDTVIANIGFAELNRMRRESPNGAALGNVTERELAFLQRVVGSLDLIQSDPQLLKNISVIREVQNKIINEGLSDADIARYSAMLGLKAKEAAPASRRAEGVVTPAASAATPFPVTPQPTVKLKSLEEHFSGTPAAR